MDNERHIHRKSYANEMFITCIPAALLALTLMLGSVKEMDRIEPNNDQIEQVDLKNSIEQFMATSPMFADSLTVSHTPQTPPNVPPEVPRTGPF